MLPWVGGLGSGLGHSLGEVDGSETSFTSHIAFTGHVLRKGTFHGNDMDFAYVIASQTQINRLLKDIETLKAEVRQWKHLFQSSSQGPKSLDSNEIWKLKTTIRDLEQQRMRELDEHQLEVAVLQNIHQKQLADVIDRHRKQLCEYEQWIEDLQHQESPGNGKDDLLQERETELRRMEQQLAEMERLDDNLNNVASDLRAENQKLVLALQDVRHQLEESILRNNEECLENNIAVRALKIKKGRLVAKLCRAEKKALEEKRKYKQTIKKLLPLEHARLIQLMQEKDLELFHLQKKIEQMDADHRETKDMLSSALEEQKQLTQVIKEKASRSNDLLEQTVEDKDMRLTSVTAENHHLKEELERLRQQSRPVPDPKILELECEVFQLNELKDDLEEEVKEQQKIIHNQHQGKIRLLQSLQEQKQKVDHLQSQQEQLHIERAQLLAAKDQGIQNLQDLADQMKAQLPDKSQHIPAEHCDDVQVTSSQPLPGENGSEKV
ncbi:thyroid receptor-interacting protein 11-like isoform X1 [Ursus americanus]|uniref:thyroid receptor-interacting protein 11-like isoform X1 n=1 Tax=Ursus americanus TaxID=9643 RepID=UPI001E6798DD|nr:thyroid receptor-interacting protein 11-like isoform X1 [Ursus americanus]XP_045632452.1 thyroid receptor-interacting protein 11-like isoform X1 [Ursus americanus]XP_045632453.1 thyroid receptor-interacting protein 11-like isoform X1 [Ursus americanus]XP_045632454.1 thyroid receptor-interacting protein 11-like isoform X1 [Ursus americanus]XP_045632455.1 thyroid receptor-interacting protein 11-like isoform X1 [Ursus americanus]